MTIEARELDRLFVDAMRDAMSADDDETSARARERLESILQARVALAQYELAHELADFLHARARSYEASVTFLVTRASPPR